MAEILWSVSDMYECSECGDAVAYQHDNKGWVYDGWRVVCTSPTCRMVFQWVTDDADSAFLSDPYEPLSEAEHAGIMHRVNTDATGEG